MDLREKLISWIDEAVELYPSELEAIVDVLIEKGATVQEWISVKDRFPENDQKVLCYNYNGEYKVLRWNYIDWM